MDQLNLIPQPRAVEPGTGTFTLTPDTTLVGPPAWAAAVRRVLTPGTGCELLPGAEGEATFLLTGDDQLGPESYRLTVTDSTITVAAVDERGANWAAQTLRQLIGAPAYGSAPIADSFAVPCVTIDDAPRFDWRGVMLDTGRHFMPITGLYAFIDLLAQHKYNVFHLHLSEDQGWRMESRAYPKLQEIASWRTESRNPEWPQGDGTPHGGFYTQDQLRALASYAAQRGITVVPEIEFPGHVRAFLAAYPEFGNSIDSQGTATEWGIFHQVLNMTDEAVDAVFSIFAELLEIFPSTYVHVGGDECPRQEWRQSEAAAALASERGLPGPEHLQRWFTERLRDFLADRGRRLVGWDEINDEGPLEGAVVMAWRGADRGVAAAAAGMEVVMSPTSHTYFDYYPSDHDDEPYSIGGHLPVETAYAFEPLEGIPDEQHPQILGTQCQVWTEYMPDMARVEYMLWPRACAHSEVAWSEPAGRSWQEFEPRLAAHLDRLAAQGVNFRPLAGPHPWQRGGTGAWRRPDKHRGQK